MRKSLTRKIFIARKFKALSRGHSSLERRKAGIIPTPSYSLGCKTTEPYIFQNYFHY